MYWGRRRAAAMISAQVNSAGATGELTPTSQTVAGPSRADVLPGVRAVSELLAVVDGAAAALGNKNVVSSNSGGSKGLNITVDEGVTGNLGTVTVTRGLATELENFLKGLDETNGLLKNRTESLQSSSGRIDKEKVRFEDRLDKMQGRLFKQFTQLDLAVSKSQQLNSYVSQQLQALQFSMLY